MPSIFVTCTILAVVMLANSARLSQARKFTINNSCRFPLNVRVVGNPAPSRGSWRAAPGTSQQVSVSASFSAGRVWAVPDGAPQVPATLFEMTLNGGGGQDFYDVSLVDGFNLPMSVSVGGGCPSRSCRKDLNQSCPNNMRVKNRSGQTVACVNRDANYFHSNCPEAYSHPHDDSVTRTCPANKRADYSIRFC